MLIFALSSLKYCYLDQLLEILSIYPFLIGHHKRTNSFSAVTTFMPYSLISITLDRFSFLIPKTDFFSACEKCSENYGRLLCVFIIFKADI